MCAELIDQIEGANLINKILFSDEATFHTCGKVNRHVYHLGENIFFNVQQMAPWIIREEVGEVFQHTKKNQVLVDVKTCQYRSK